MPKESEDIGKKKGRGKISLSTRYSLAYTLYLKIYS
jgi:hypothetical protein